MDVRLSEQETALAERAGGGSVSRMTDAMVLAVGWVVARRDDPTLGLRGYLAAHRAADVREELGISPPAKKTTAKKTTAKDKKR